MITDTVKKTIENAKAGLRKALGQERVSQFTPDPNSKWACFFTCFYMYFRTTRKMKLTLDEYRKECRKAGAIDEKYMVLNHTKMAAAAGYPELVAKNTSTKIKEAIFALLLKGEPVPFSLAGRHYESIDGYEVENGEILFTVDDPGGQGDTFCEADTLCVFRVEGDKRVYSRHPDGSKRKITTVYYFDKKRSL